MISVKTGRGAAAGGRADGLRAGMSAAMARRGFDPIYDRGQILIDMALTPDPGR